MDMSKANRRRHYLADADRSYIADLVAATTLTGAARELDMQRQTVTALLAEAGVTAGTLALARERIAASRARAAQA